MQVYSYLYLNQTWSLDTIFSHPEAYRPQHRFGGPGGVAISGIQTFKSEASRCSYTGYIYV
jgi:hypothetical protein